jgi:alginate O-acetyltransferase complex protein AlgI
MGTASLQFVAFGLFAALLSNLRRAPRWRAAILLEASIVFLVILAGDLPRLLPLAAFLALGYLSIAIVARGRSGAAPFIALTVFAYLWLKKYTFLPHRLFLGVPYLTLGLSYVFFRVLHLIIEVGDPASRPVVTPAGYLAYTLNFTTFISGPIQRYEAFARDEYTDAPAELDAGIVVAQFERLIRGICKVNILALLLNIVHDDSLAELTRPGPLSAKALAGLKLVTAYPFFLYANFSGYIDIVIALARLMRLRLPENFDRPFTASSFIDFWNRWHITLSTWLKTYVYNPLLIALSRKFRAASLQAPFAVFGLFVTFFLIGVWHGRTSEFAFFGILQGGGVAVNLCWQLGLAASLGRKRYKKIAAGRIYEALGRGLTFTWFALTLCWFWGDWPTITAGFAALGAARWMAVLASLWLLAATVLTGWDWLRKAMLRLPAGVSMFETAYARAIWSTALVFIWAALSFVINQPAPDIVYKAF